MPKSQMIAWIGQDHGLGHSIGHGFGFGFALSKDAAAAMLEELLMLLSLLSVSSITSSSISSAVRSGKEVKTGTGTSAQHGMACQADSISG